MKLTEIYKKWNESYPYDFLYRTKLTITFNSEQHRRLNQLDVFFYFYDAYMKQKLEKDIKRDKKQEKESILNTKNKNIYSNLEKKEDVEIDTNFVDFIAKKEAKE